MKTKLELLRNVQQGELELEDIDEYELAEKANDGAANVPTEEWAAQMEREAEAIHDEDGGVIGGSVIGGSVFGDGGFGDGDFGGGS